MVPLCDHLPDLASCMRTFWPGISGVSSIPPLDILAFCFSSSLASMISAKSAFDLR